MRLAFFWSLPTGIFQGVRGCAGLRGAVSDAESLGRPSKTTYAWLRALMDNFGHRNGNEDPDKGFWESKQNSGEAVSPEERLYKLEYGKKGQKSDGCVYQLVVLCMCSAAGRD